VNPVENLNYYYDNGIMPRIYPSGALLVQMCAIFLAGILFVKERKSHWETAALMIMFIPFFIFILSLRQRSAILSLFITGAFLLKGFINIKNRRRNLIVIFSLGLVMFIGISFIDTSGNLNFIEETIERFHNEDLIHPNRLLDNGLAISTILRSPLFGIGRTNVQKEVEELELDTLGSDVHPLLATGLLAGIPFMILVCSLICYLYWRYRLGRKTHQDWVVIAVSSAIFYALFLAFINISPVFTVSKDMVPFLIFTGLFLSYENKSEL
jgi:hypothetical protein